MEKGILLISYNQKVTDGIKEMVEQMQKSGEVQIFSLGGINGEVGLDPTGIVEAVNELSDAASYSVFADIGSMVLNSELTKDMLRGEQQQRYHLADTPLVEGALAVTITAGIADDAQQILTEIQNAGKKGWEQIEKNRE